MEGNFLSLYCSFKAVEEASLHWTYLNFVKLQLAEELCLDLCLLLPYEVETWQPREHVKAD